VHSAPETIFLRILSGETDWWKCLQASVEFPNFLNQCERMTVRYRLIDWAS